MESREYKKLHAEWYELATTGKDYREEMDFWTRCIAAAGEPVLELGTGTGKVLIPLLDRGFDVCGIDTSKDMTGRCLALCAAKGLKPEIHDQPMQSFSLERKFALVLLTSGGLGLFVADQDIHATFQRVAAHLRPGGMFAYEFEPAPVEEMASGTAKDRWVSDWLCGSGGVVINWRQRHKYDAASRTWKQLMVFEKFVDGRLLETEAAEREGRLFTVEEACQFAAAAGFEDIRATKRFTEEPPDKDTKVVTVRCRKSSKPS